MPSWASKRTLPAPARYAWILPLALATAANTPILHSFFRDDDFLNLYFIVNDQPWWHFLFRMHGGHLLITRNAVFALWFQVFGPDPLPYQVLALATHLVNVGLTYRVARTLTGSWRLACLTAAAWGAAASNLATLGWYSVHGQALATMTGLWVLSRLAACRAGAPCRRAAPWGWGAAMLVGGTCFGIGLGLALAMPLIAWLLLPPGRLRGDALLALVTAAGATIGVYLATASFSSSTLQVQHIGTSLQDIFSSSHLTTLLAITGRGIVSAATAVVPVLPDSPLTVGILTLVALACAWHAWHRAWRPFVACLLFALCTYEAIAVGRVPLVAALGPAATRELTQADRYQYAGPVGLLLAVAAVCATIRVANALPRSARTVALLAWATGAAATIALRPPIDHHHAAKVETEAVLSDIRRRIAAAPPGAQVRIPLAPFHSVGLINLHSYPLFPGNAAIFAVFFDDDVVDGRRVVFTTTNGAMAEGARVGRRSAALIRLTE